MLKSNVPDSTSKRTTVLLALHCAIHSIWNPLAEGRGTVPTNGVTSDIARRSKEPPDPPNSPPNIGAPTMGLPPTSAEPTEVAVDPSSHGQYASGVSSSGLSIRRNMADFSGLAPWASRRRIPSARTGTWWSFSATSQRGGHSDTKPTKRVDNPLPG